MGEEQQSAFEVLYDRWRAAEEAAWQQWNEVAPMLERALEGGPLPPSLALECIGQGGTGSRPRYPPAD